MASERRSVVVGPRAAVLRRRLGPTAWVVLEQLLAVSTGEADCCRVCVSVRTLAAELAMSKDTVARALARLRLAGIVSADQPRSATGRFAAGSYVIEVPDAIAFDDTDHTSTTASTRPRPLGSPSRLAAVTRPGRLSHIAIDRTMCAVPDFVSRICTMVRKVPRLRSRSGCGRC